jgi:DNA-binding HxlR family transcriptional regulator
MQSRKADSSPKADAGVYASAAAAPSGCPMTAALNAVGGKWSLICLYWLDSGTRRFNELQRLMPDISHKVLTATLRNLETEGLICRTDFLEVPPRVEYRISPYGESVRPLIEAVRLWGRAHLARRQSGSA